MYRGGYIWMTPVYVSDRVIAHIDRHYARLVACREISPAVVESKSGHPRGYADDRGGGWWGGKGGEEWVHRPTKYTRTGRAMKSRLSRGVRFKYRSDHAQRRSRSDDACAPVRSLCPSWTGWIHTSRPRGAGAGGRTVHVLICRRRAQRLVKAEILRHRP